MDVTALTHVKNEQLNSKGLTLVDEEAFAGEIDKLISESNTKKSLPSTKDSSQSSVESEGEERGDEEEHVEFTLIHPFLRLQTDIDTLSKGQTIQTLHIEKHPEDKELNIELSEFISDELDSNDDLKITDSSVDSQLVETIPTQFTGEPNEISNTLADKNQPDEFTAAADFSKEFDLLNTSLEDTQNTSKLIAELTNNKPLASEEKESIDKQLLMDSDNVEVSNAKKTTTIEETRSISKQTSISETPVEPESMVTKDTLAVGPKDSEAVSQLNFFEEADNQSTNELNLNTVNTERQLNISVPKSVDPVHLPVSKEQSIEVIQDMMMTVVKDESGKEVFKSTLTLTPENLGEVKIELVYNETGLSGKLVFESDETKIWMENQWHQLKQPLESKGLTLNQFNFSVTDPVSLPHTDGFAFSQEFNQPDHQAAKEESQSIGAPQILESEEEILHLKTGNSSNGINIYA